MKSSPVAALAIEHGTRGLAFVRNRVLLALLVCALAAALGLAFLTVAPNRLVSGTGVALGELLSGARLALGLPAAGLLLAVLAPPSRGATHVLVALLAALLLAGLVGLAGDAAALRSASLPAIARVSFGGGFWVLALLAWLAAADA